MYFRAILLLDRQVNQYVNVKRNTRDHNLAGRDDDDEEDVNSERSSERRHFRSVSIAVVCSLLVLCQRDTVGCFFHVAQNSLWHPRQDQAGDKVGVGGLLFFFSLFFFYTKCLKMPFLCINQSEHIFLKTVFLSAGLFVINMLSKKKQKKAFLQVLKIKRKSNFSSDLCFESESNPGKTSRFRPFIKKPGCGDILW